MPNWCHNVLKITGPKDEIQSIVNTQLDFEKIFPTPADLIPDTCDKFGMTEFQKQANLIVYGHESWYGWRVVNWGTKWNPSETVITQSDTKTIDVVMNTAWSPPLKLLKKLSVEHPSTTIRIVDCEDEGGFFVGDCTILSGEIIEENIHEPTDHELRERGMLCEDDD